MCDITSRLFPSPVRDPIMWTTGSGIDVMKWIAAPMIGGMVFSTVLTLLVIPGLYALWRGRSLPTNEGNAMTTDAC